MDLARLEPVPELLRRVRSELAASFATDKPLRVARAPGRLDVMGGIADYMGSLVLEMPLQVAAAVALQERDDRQVQVFSFNLLDDHRPFQFQVPLDALAKPLDELRRDLDAPGRQWAGYAVGPLAVLHDEGLIDVATLDRGFNLAILSTVPEGGGVSSSAALEVAAMNAFVGHLDVQQLVDDPVGLAALCQKAENQVVGAPCGVMDQIASHMGQAGTLLKILCQPHDVQGTLPLPDGVVAVGLNTAVKHAVGGGAYGKTRTAAFMGHRLILDEMRKLGEAGGKTMTGDPTNGYLANLDPDDYKQLFRPRLPETLVGAAFLDQSDSHNDPATTIDPAETYHVQSAVDHHVLDAQRVRRFADFFERLDHHGRDKALRSAGHLMYASHKSYTDNADLGATEADFVIDQVKQHEPAGLFGARITGGGSGGTVAVLLEDAPSAWSSIEAIQQAYEARHDQPLTLLRDSSPGAAATGSQVVG
ncbi:MAG: galactokinase family protein [Planctomycetota bacterium]